MISRVWAHGTNLDRYSYRNNARSAFVREVETGTVVNTANGSAAARPCDGKTWGDNVYDAKDGWSNENALNIQGYDRPNGTTGEILYAPGAVGASSYRTPRQIQRTLRLDC
ncbi:MAG TPA: hypothetical protein VMA34_03990 [Terracidiphilus sp.]|nr:hypothetical protein [Terracidiphilus sp.]